MQIEKGQVQQKECTGDAVVKSGKLYVVKCHVYQQSGLPETKLLALAEG